MGVNTQRLRRGRGADECLKKDAADLSLNMDRGRHRLMLTDYRRAVLGNVLGCAMPSTASNTL